MSCGSPRTSAAARTWELALVPTWKESFTFSFSMVICVSGRGKGAWAQEPWAQESAWAVAADSSMPGGWRRTANTYTCKDAQLSTPWRMHAGGSEGERAEAGMHAACARLRGRTPSPSRSML